MKKKSLVLLIGSIAMLLLALMIYFQDAEKRRPGQNDWDFAISEPEQIYRIFLADREGNRTLLEKNQDGSWRYNGQFPVRPNAIENLLDAIRRVKLKYRPSNEAIPGMISSLATEGIKVEIFGKSGQQIKTYYVGGATVDERGTYMIMEGSENPYVAYIPGWEGNLRFRFNLRGDDWKDKALFSGSQDDITALTVSYPKQRNKSFRIEKQGGTFLVKPAFDLVPEIAAKLNEAAVEKYLRTYNRLVAEAFSNQYPEKDSIVSMVPFCTVKMERKDQIKTVHFFPIFSQPSLDLKSGQWVGTTEAERYYAYIEEQDDFMLIQHRVFGEIFRAYSSFFD